MTPILHRNNLKYKHGNSSGDGLVLIRTGDSSMKPLYLVAILFVAIAIALLQGAKWRDDGVIDPFAAYASFMPGQRQPTGWDCSTEREYYALMEHSFYCSRTLNHPAVVWVSVSGRDGVIRRTAFGLRLLRYADLVGVWGGSWRITRSGSRYRLQLGSLTAYTFRRIGRLSMHTRVYYLSISEPIGESR